MAQLGRLRAPIQGLLRAGLASYGSVSQFRAIGLNGPTRLMTRLIALSGPDGVPTGSFVNNKAPLFIYSLIYFWGKSM